MSSSPSFEWFLVGWTWLQSVQWPPYEQRGAAVEPVDPAIHAVVVPEPSAVQDGAGGTDSIIESGKPLPVVYPSCQPTPQRIPSIARVTGNVQFVVLGLGEDVEGGILGRVPLVVDFRLYFHAEGIPGSGHHLVDLFQPDPDAAVVDSESGDIVDPGAIERETSVETLLNNDPVVYRYNWDRFKDSGRRVQ